MLGRRLFAIALAAGSVLAASLAAVVTADGPAARPEGRTLAPADLAEFLKEAGLSPREENGRQRVQRKAGASIYCLVSLSPDARYVWITAPLAELPKERPYVRARLVELLMQNAAPDGVHFGIVGDSLQLLRAVDNRALLPGALGLEVDAFFGVMVRTARTWDVRGWVPTEAPGPGMGEAPPAMEEPPMGEPPMGEPPMGEPPMGEPAMTEGR